MAELADARGSGPRTRKGVEVRVLFSAPKHQRLCTWHFLGPCMLQPRELSLGLFPFAGKFLCGYALPADVPHSLGVGWGLRDSATLGRAGQDATAG
jgi:hypothetical protein